MTDDGLFQKLAEAAHGKLGPSCRDLEPIRGLLAGGVSWADILGYVAHCGHTLKQPLRSFGPRWFTDGVRKFSQGKRQLADSALSEDGRDITEFIPESDPHFPALADRLRREQGRGPGRRYDRHGAPGWWFGSRWVESLRTCPFPWDAGGNSRDTRDGDNVTH